MRTKELFNFIYERHRIYERKLRGLPKPWTIDPILQTYRFCNVYRELDTVTQWIATNWREPFKESKDLWFAMVVARLVNWPDTLEELDLEMDLLHWKPERLVRVLHRRKAQGSKVFSGAYIVSTNGRAMDKAEYLANHVLTPLWEQRKNLRPVFSEGLDLYHQALTNFDGLGSFLAAQVIADIKYVVSPDDCPDWWTFAASGPGSRRGLNIVMGRPMDAPWKEEEWRINLSELQKVVDPAVKKWGMPRLHAQDLQNCLCETSKMCKVLNGVGRPRAKYPGV